MVHRLRSSCGACLAPLALLVVVAATPAWADETRAPTIEMGPDFIHRLRTSPRSDLVLPLPTGRSITLRLTPFNLLTKDARITETSAKGTRAFHPDITFLKGEVPGDGDTWAALTVTPRGVTGYLHTRAQEFEVAPGDVRPDGVIVHSVRESSLDPALASGSRCGVEDFPNAEPQPLSQRMLSPEAPTRAGVRLACDIAFDCDWDLYDRFGRDLDRVTEYVLATIASVRFVYERDLNVTIRVVYLNFWTTPDDPYSATGSYERATEFAAWWAANRSFVPCAMAHLLTGYNLSNYGFGFYDAICAPRSGSGVSSIGVFGIGLYGGAPGSWDINLVAHEIGHAFGSRHTQSCFWQERGFVPAGTLLDSCVAAEDGTCYTGPTGITPPGGGTIMSYCRSRSEFHPVCSSWMRGRAESCLPTEDYGPLVRAPGTVVGTENSSLTFTITASDPDLEPIQSLTASQLPPGATFTADPTMTQGTLEWTPVCQQAGTYGITFTATSTAAGSATTVVTILPVDCPPVVTAPDVVQGREGELLFLEMSAMDREDPLFDLATSPLPAGASFSTTEDFTGGVLIWAPGYAQAGTYPITFTATNGMQGFATTRIEIANTDRSPAVGAPKTASTIPGLLLQIHVTASDPDGEPIESLEAGRLPPGASFTVGTTKTSADLRWLPSPGQEGTYSVVFTAANALSFSATTRIDVLASADHPPEVAAPTVVGGSEGSLLEIHVRAADPDGDPILSLTNGPLPSGAAFLADPGGTGGTLSWMPGFDQAGSYEVALRAVSKAGTAPALTGTSTMALSIANTDRAPSVLAPSDVTVSEGAPLSCGVSVVDPDGDPVESLVPDLSSLPLGNGARFTVGAGNSQGTLTWTPAFSDAGDYALSFTAANALSGSAHTTVHVVDTNRAPTAVAGGPYEGFAGISLSLSGGASSDADGDALTYLWDFGDQTQGVGVAPAHAYAASGDFAISLSVFDGTLSSRDETIAHIALIVEANAYVTDRNRTIRLRSAKPTWCALIEPTTSSFDPASVDPASVALALNGSKIYSVPGKETVIGDWDRDGLPELAACFSKADLRTLFASLPAGKHTIPVEIEGALLEGGRIRAPLQIDVVSDEASLSATIAPNPATPNATLTFATPRAGRAKVTLFDSQGRLVRTLLDESALAAGYHDLRAIGLDAEGKRLPSGVYFYQIETPQGTSTGRFAITR